MCKSHLKACGRGSQGDTPLAEINATSVEWAWSSEWASRFGPRGKLAFRPRSARCKRDIAPACSVDQHFSAPPP